MIKFAIYNTASGIVLRTGSSNNEALAQSQAGDGESFDDNPPVGVVADGLWQYTPSGYVHNTPAIVTPSVNDLKAYATGKLQYLLTVTKIYTVSNLTLKSDSLPATLADWLALMQWAIINPTGTTQWINNDGTTVPLPAVEINGFSLLVGNYSQSLWQALATVLGDISSGTINTLAEIDAYIWPS